MKIKCEVKYLEEYIPPRCRKPRYREAVKEITYTIPECMYEDAPIAFRVEGCGPLPGQPESTMEHWDEYRWYKNKLYTRVKASEKTCGDKGWWTIDKLISLHSTHRHWNYSANFNEVRKDARYDLSKYLIINGDEVWKKVGEPRYVIMTFGLGGNHASTDLMTSVSYNPNIASSSYFNALQRDEAIARAKEVALGRGDTDSVDSIGEFWRIEVLIPEAVRCKANKYGQKVVGGDPFMNKCENTIQAVKDPVISALLIMGSIFDEKER